MSLFSIKGAVTAIGQSQFNNAITIYAYLEITEPSGRRVKIDQVAVCNDVAAAFRLGAERRILRRPNISVLSNLPMPVMGY